MNTQLSGTTLQQQYFNSKSIQEVAPSENISTEEFTALPDKASSELVNNGKNLLVESIKKLIIDLVYYSEEQIKTNLSDYLSEKLGYNYTYMANLFSKVHGTCIQSFIIATKIERVKELLIYEDLTLTEIAFKLHYSSSAHLSNQFKKVTGSNPSQFIASLGGTGSLAPNSFPGVFITYTDSLENEFLNSGRSVGK